MSSPRFERFLAQLYVDREIRERFLADPKGVASGAGLSQSECAAVVSIDRVGLKMAAESFARKRSGKPQTISGRWARRLIGWWT